MLRRTIRYAGRSRPELPEGCVQRFDANTASFLSFIWKDRHAGRQQIADTLDPTRKSPRIHHLRGPRDVRAFKRDFLAR